MEFFKTLIVLLVVSSHFYVQAQEEKSVNDIIIDTKTDLPEIKQNTDSIIDKLKKEISTLKEKETELKGANFDNDQIIKSKVAEIKRFNDLLILSDSIIESKNKRLIFADSIIGRISNDCLRKKSDSIRIDKALIYFGEMYSPELKSKFSPLEKLLKEYLNYSKEISDILAEAENDREIKNIFDGDKKAQSYISKIKSTRYYQDVYNANWTIPYLNNLIDKVIKELRSFDPKVSRELKLTDKMN